MAYLGPVSLEHIVIFENVFASIKWMYDSKSSYGFVFKDFNTDRQSVNIRFPCKYWSTILKSKMNVCNKIVWQGNLFHNI